MRGNSIRKCHPWLQWMPKIALLKLEKIDSTSDAPFHFGRGSTQLQVSHFLLTTRVHTPWD